MFKRFKVNVVVGGLLLQSLLFLGSCSDNNVVKKIEPQTKSINRQYKYSELEKIADKLKPLHKKMGPINPGDWLEHHPEKGQTFKEYIAVDPRVATGNRKVIYVRPIGALTKMERDLVEITAEYIGIFYGLSVVVLKDIAIDEDWPEFAKRKNEYTNEQQLLTGYILNGLLAPGLPDDAAALIGFTASDLWPGEGWNYVFGMASIVDRVGVWSIARNGNLQGSQKEKTKCLERTLKTAVHELGHMFSIQHCTAFECGMCGSNSLEESDSRPIGFCPQCLSKLVWATGVNPKERFRLLIRFYQKHKLFQAANHAQKSLKALKAID
ncbi:MAG: hypothetical protein JXR91_16680 [Deltaproteobacteria bacterium]|nr:hypothetical protein [Deltaproteobacteria bacterium]